MFTQENFNTIMSNIRINNADYNKFVSYAEQLVDWNTRVNLTAITDDEGVLVKHFADSLLPITKLELPQGASLIDVGTGAGFPSVPMKLVRSDIELTLLDSLEKRLNFLRSLCQSLDIKAATVHARAEDAGKNPQHREKYDVATSRAVASMAELAEYCLPLVKLGGVVLALKGSSGRDEVSAGTRAIELCGGKVEEIIDYNLPNGDPRCLVILRKISPTPPKYPRNSAQMAKKSL